MAKLTRAELARRGAIAQDGDTSRPGVVRTSQKAMSALKSALKSGISSDELHSALMRHKAGKETGTTSTVSELERGKAKAQKSKEDTQKKDDDEKNEVTSLKLTDFESFCSSHELDEVSIPSSYLRKAGIATQDLEKRNMTIGQQMEVFRDQVYTMKEQGLPMQRAMQIVKQIYSEPEPEL